VIVSPGPDIDVAEQSAADGAPDGHIATKGSQPGHLRPPCDQHLRACAKATCCARKAGAARVASETPELDEDRSRASATATRLLAAKNSSAAALDSKPIKRAWHSRGLATVLAHRRRSLSFDWTAPSSAARRPRRPGCKTRVLVSRPPTPPRSLPIAFFFLPLPSSSFLIFLFFSTLISLSHTPSHPWFVS
jgi:hypothetical protein